MRGPAERKREPAERKRESAEKEKDTSNESHLLKLVYEECVAMDVARYLHEHTNI